MEACGCEFRDFRWCDAIFDGMFEISRLRNSTADSFFFDTSMMGACNVGEMEDPPAILCICKDLVSHRKLSIFESGRNFVSKLRGTEPFVS